MQSPDAMYFYVNVIAGSCHHYSGKFQIHTLTHAGCLSHLGGWVGVHVHVRSPPARGKYTEVFRIDELGQ